MAGVPARKPSAENQPMHAPSQGFKEGGPSGITKIMEADEPST